MVDWQEINIGNDTILKARIGWQGLTTSEYKDSGDYYLVTGTDFENGLVNWDTCHFVDKWRFDQDKNIQIKVNDVLITKDGTIGKAGFVETLKLPATLNSGVFVIRPTSNNLDQKYLYYVFTSEIFDEFLNKLTAGSTINHLYQKDFVHFIFNAPKIEEQKAIAKALSDTDELISSLEKLISKKEAIKQGTMQQLLTGKKRLSGFISKWEEQRLEELVIFINGKAHESNISEFGKYVVINSKFVSSNGYVKKYSNEILQSVQKNDIAMVMSDVPNGKAIAKCFYIEQNNVYTLNQRICLLRAVKIDSRFLFYIINRHKYYLSFDDGAKQTNLRRQDILNCFLNIPTDIKEQQSIAQILFDMDNEIETLKLKLSKTKAIKDGMMSELLTGKTRLI